MTSSQTLIAAADTFIAARKRILGAQLPPQWAPGFTPHELVTKYPLELAGELLGQLMIVGFPRERALKFRLGILIPAMVCRLDYTNETHANSIDGVLTGAVPPIVTGPHYHSWPLNRRFFHGMAMSRPPKLYDAAPYTEPGRTFDAVLRWFCDNTNIEPLPPDHRIVLPQADLLI
jgi:hypothetical protein